MKYKLDKTILFFLILLLLFSGCTRRTSASERDNLALAKTENNSLIYFLPPPNTEGVLSVEAALANRRSRRHFLNQALTMEQLSQILWAAYGITAPIPGHPALRGGLRTTPSAGALFPLEIYVVVGNVYGLTAGVYKYISEKHKLVRIIDRDIRAELSRAALNQLMVRDAPVTLVYTAVFERITARYGERGRERYVWIELGHSAQNVYLQAEALGLGTCAIGAFIDSRVSELLQLPADERPVYLMPLGFY